MALAGHLRTADTYENLLLIYSILQHIKYNLATDTSNFRAGPSTNSHPHGNKEISTGERENTFLILENLKIRAYLSPHLHLGHQLTAEETGTSQYQNQWYSI